MILWIDAQLSPHLVPWLRKEFGIEAYSARQLGFRDAKDREIFQAAREANAVVLTKDLDFVHLVGSLGPPPKILWLTCGNTSNAHLRTILAKTLPQAMALLQRGESLVEIREA